LRIRMRTRARLWDVNDVASQSNTTRHLQYGDCSEYQVWLCMHERMNGNVRDVAASKLRGRMGRRDGFNGLNVTDPHEGWWPCWLLTALYHKILVLF